MTFHSTMALRMSCKGVRIRSGLKKVKSPEKTDSLEDANQQLISIVDTFLYKSKEKKSTAIS